MAGTHYKACASCGMELLVSMFCRDRSRSDGLSRSCKACCAKYQAKYRKRPGYAEAQGRRVRSWIKDHPDAIARYQAKVRRRRSADKMELLNQRIRSQILYSMRSRKGGSRSFDALDYTSKQLATHLERQFVSGMGWHNMGEWHIDHIVPRKTFHFESVGDPEFKRCWALSNLRPIWGKDNRIKKDKRTHLI